MKRKPQNSAAFFENNSWYHRTKILQDDGSIKYSKKGGFATSEEADKSYRRHEDEFKKAYRAYHLAHQINTEVTLKDYLIYWFEEIFSQRIETTTRMVGAYAVYDLILPNIEYDIKVRFTNVEYLDALLERVAKVSASAGNKGREILNMAMKEAVIGGYIKTNPVIGTKPYKRQKPKITILSKEKIKVLLKASSENNWYLEILLGLFCGLRKGEILGLGGLVGAGRTELAEMIFGAVRKKSGKMIFNGKEIDPKSPREAINLGIALVPEDRKRHGAMLGISIKNNINMPIYERNSKLSVINNKQEQEIAEKYKENMAIKTPSLNQLVKNLSGGNQQKVILGRWMAADSELIIFDEPTRGIDVGAKYEIYKLMNDLVENQGKTILMISSEMEELMGMSDRIVVLSEGNMTGELSKDEFTQEVIMTYASAARDK